MRPCVLRDGGPCLVCKEDMELKQKIQELQDRRTILRTHMNASHDPFHFKFPPEIASLIFFFVYDRGGSRTKCSYITHVTYSVSSGVRQSEVVPVGTLDTSTLVNPLVYP